MYIGVANHLGEATLGRHSSLFEPAELVQGRPSRRQAKRQGGRVGEMGFGMRPDVSIRGAALFWR
jgi:hypothetical protein